MAIATLTRRCWQEPLTEGAGAAAAACISRRPPAAVVVVGAAPAPLPKLAMAELKVCERTSALVRENGFPPVTVDTPTGTVDTYRASTACTQT
jgi:hypothetical protein